MTAPVPGLLCPGDGWNGHRPPSPPASQVDLAAGYPRALAAAALPWVLGAPLALGAQAAVGAHGALGRRPGGSVGPARAR